MCTQSQLQNSATSSATGTKYKGSGQSKPGKTGTSTSRSSSPRNPNLDSTIKSPSRKQQRGDKYDTRTGTSTKYRQQREAEEAFKRRPRTAAPEGVLATGYEKVTRPEQSTPQSPAETTQTQPSPTVQVQQVSKPEISTRIDTAPDVAPATERDTKTDDMLRYRERVSAKPDTVKPTGPAKRKVGASAFAPLGVRPPIPVGVSAEEAARKFKDSGVDDLKGSRRTAGGTRLSSPGAETRARIGAETRRKQEDTKRQSTETDFKRMVKGVVQDAFLDLRK